MQIRKKSTEIFLGKELRIANTFFSRLKGLMFVDSMEGFDALLITRCNSIHNFFVRFPIDVIFLNSEFKVVKIIKSFKPWRVSGIYFSASQVLELPENTITDEIQCGDYLEVINV